MKFAALLLYTFLLIQNTCGGQKSAADKSSNRAAAEPSKNAEVRTNSNASAENSKAKDPGELKKKENNQKMSENIKILASGGYSGVEEPFIFVARDENSLEKLKNFPINKIEFDEKIDFSKSMVVAAFAGTHRTGGYSVEFERSGDGSKILVKLNAPPKDAMVTQALTQPFSIALVSLSDGEPVGIEAADVWKNSMKNFKITEGSFEFSGGIAGAIEEFEIEGAVRVYRLGNWVTVGIDVRGTGSNAERNLSETLTGELAGNSFSAVAAGGSLIENPHSPLIVKIDFSAGDRKISAKLVARDPKSPIRDGFSGEGSFVAERKD